MAAVTSTISQAVGSRAAVQSVVAISRPVIAAAGFSGRTQRSMSCSLPRSTFLSPSEKKLMLSRSRLAVTPRKGAGVVAETKTVVKATEVTEENFAEEVLKSDVPVLVDFWASWCGPCRLMAPIMDWAANEYAGRLKVVKVDTSKSAHLVEKYKVYGLPTLVIFQNGEKIEASHTEGAVSKDRVIKLIADFAPSVAA